MSVKFSRVGNGHQPMLSRTLPGMSYHKSTNTTVGSIMSVLGIHFVQP